MDNKLYHLFPIRQLMKRKGLSEYDLARLTKISRLTIRALLRGHVGSRLSSWIDAATALEHKILLVSEAESTSTDFSVQGVCFQVQMDGESSWKIHFMNFVDEFRRSMDTRLIALPPPSNLSDRLKALMASIVCELCRENAIQAPRWAERTFTLSKPWFVSESEALKPMMIVESPLAFRRNQIFVGTNFLDRT
jgi:hypothetical protein